MAYVKWQMDWVPFINNDWDENNRETLTSFHTPMVNVSLGDKRDAYKFKIRNFNSNFNNKFNPNDKIYIYRVVNTDTIDLNAPLMVATVQNAPSKDNATKKELTIEGYNYSEDVAKAIVFVDGANRPIPVVMEEALANAGNGSNFKVTWNQDNPTLKTDDTAFPGINERFFYKPLRDLIEKYSQRQNTKDGTYYWFINTDNELVWRPQTSATTGTFNSEIDKYRDIKDDKDKDGIVNFVIIKGGLDPAGKPIQTKEYDASSIAKNGRKFKLLIGQTINAQSLNQADVLESNSGDENVTSRFPASYPFTTTWTSSVTATVEGVSMVEGSAVTVNSDKEYTGVLREHIITLLKEEARSYIDLKKNGTLKVDIEVVPGQLNWGLGDNITVTIPAIDEANKVMRVQEIQYTTTSDTYSLEEDVGTLT